MVQIKFHVTSVWMATNASKKSEAEFSGNVILCFYQWIVFTKKFVALLNVICTYIICALKQI